MRKPIDRRSELACHVTGSASCVWGWGLPRLLAMGLLAMVWAGMSPNIGNGQEKRPETLPDVLETSSIPFKAFMFPDENGGHVVITDMTFAEIDQARNARAGLAEPSKPYSYERITISGVADNDWAELTINFKLSVAPPQGRAVAIPLKMSGFHPQGPLDVVGAEDYTVDYSLEQGGHLLWVEAKQRRDIEVSVRAVSRVTTDAGGGLEFNLPTAPTSVNVSLRGEDLEATVVGRGDEAVRVAEGEPGRTKANVECNGGAFSLRWRARDGRLPSDQVLEVDSRMRVTWDDLNGPPRAIVELDVSNRRGSLAPFEVRLPVGAEVIEPLQSSAGAQLALRSSQSGIVQVTPDDTEQSSRLKVTLEYRLPAGEYKPELPLVLSAVEVPAAVRQRGELEIRTDRNYRLRWLQSSAVRSAWRTSAADTPDARVYLFQYDRVPFELPIWLTAKTQPLRIDHTYTIRVSETAATLEAEIMAAGTIVEGLPLIVDSAGWETVDVSDLETGRSLDDSFGDLPGQLELELGELTPALNGTVGVRWTAARRIEATATETVVEFPLPRIRTLDQRTVILAPGQLLVQPDAGFSLITDLVASEGLIRLPREATEAANSGVFRYRLQSVGEPPRYRGYLKETPPEATITGALEMVAEASSIRITADWLVTPQGSLRGQLPIENVGDQGQLLYQLIGSRESGQRESGQSEQPALATSWKVTVNGQPAVIRPASGGELRAGISAIYSEQLASQPCQIRLLGSLPLRLAEATLENKNPQVRAELRLPRPALPSGSWQPDLGLRTVESPGLSLLVSGVEQAADEPLDLSGNGAVMVTLESRVDELVRAPVIERALMRSELGRGRRFDRLLANVSGGSPSFRVEFAASFDDALSGPQAADQPVVRIFLDGEERFDFEQSASGLEIPFEPASESRMIDIRVWSAHDGSGPATSVRPRLRLPISTGKTYWDVVLAPDRHLVWSMSGASELMVWRYDRLFVRRVPIRSYADLLNWMGAGSPPETQAGNRYLLVTSDPGALEFYESGRPLLWLTIASIVLGATAFLLYYPVLRHPMVAVVAGCLLAGLAWIAPDLAVIAGQLVIVAMLLVAVMMGTRAILTRRPRATVLGGLADGSSVRSAAARRNSGSNVELKTTQIQEAVPSGSAAGVQS